VCTEYVQDGWYTVYEGPTWLKHPTYNQLLLIDSATCMLIQDQFASYHNEAMNLSNVISSSHLNLK